MSTTVSASGISKLPTDYPEEGCAARPKTAVKANAQLTCWLMMVSYHSQSASAESLASLQELAGSIPSETDGFPEVRPVVDAIQAFAQTKIYDPLLPGKASAALRLLKSDVEIL
ncbi:MAG TPA: hypothetical protein VIJ46_05300 [Rhabdochlamydiaceae bacterium]